MSIHSRNDDVILEFGLRKPAFRICVNTPTTHGSIGLTTGLDPAMTLGCGGWGGNITSDNISPRHLLNIKRVAYEVRPAIPSATAADAGAAFRRPETASTTELPKAPERSVSRGIPVDTLADRIDQFLSSRGYKPSASADAAADKPLSAPSVAANQKVVDFVCEDDVRAAIKAGGKLVVGEKTIITPSARELGEANRVFVQAGWRY